jgi:uncharacterized protein YbjT (DUF2867 family)
LHFGDCGQPTVRAANREAAALPEDARRGCEIVISRLFPAVVRFSLLPHRQKGVFYV